MAQTWKMKDLAESERPYEKCMAEGPSVLSDAELLAVILRSGSRKNNALVTAQKILSAHPVYKGIVGLNYLSTKELMTIDGVGTVKAIQMQCVAELSRRMAHAEKRSGLALSDPASIADYFMEHVRYLEKERVYLMLFDMGHRLLKEICLSQGTFDRSLVSARDIFIEAVKYEAAYMVLIHNHPSGNPEPSREDILLTRQIAKLSETLGIRLSDHIIIGNNCFVSLAERGVINETTKS